MLGDPGVGKTALIRKFVNGTVWSNDNCRSEGAVTRSSRELVLLEGAGGVAAADSGAGASGAALVTAEVWDSEGRILKTDKSVMA